MLFFVSKTLMLVALAGVMLVLASSAAALWQARRGNSKTHRLAFCSGVLGLVCLPIALLGLIGIFMQPLTAQIMSFAGLALVLGTSLAVIACFTSYSSMLMLYSVRQDTVGDRK